MSSYRSTYTFTLFLGLGMILGPMALAIFTIRTLHVPTASERLGYTLSDIRSTGRAVPRVYIARLPADLSQITSVGQRKSLFIRITLPLILRVNDDIVSDRERLRVLINQVGGGNELRSRDRRWIADLAREYRTGADDLGELLTRVDTIPPSLALAQAAIESGWGTSRFARQGNALYGQWSFDGKGIVPDGRDAGKTHRIKAFPRLLESVAEYARNLNSHAAYRDFRTIRAQFNSGQLRANGDRLAGTLGGYSERGTLYIDELRTIIRVNGLLDFDSTALEEPA